MLIVFSLESNVFVLCLSDNLGLCSAYNKCYLVRPRLDPLTARVVLICLFVSQWIWLGSDHMFYIFSAGNSSVSQFSKGVGWFLCLGRGVVYSSHPLGAWSDNAHSCSGLHSYLCYLAGDLQVCLCFSYSSIAVIRPS